MTMTIGAHLHGLLFSVRTFHLDFEDTDFDVNTTRTYLRNICYSSCPALQNDLGLGISRPV